MQQIVVYFILACAIGYAAWWIYKRLQKVNDPCDGCDGCQLKELKERAKQCQKQKKSNYCTKK
jgi:hypothetical protein